MAGGLDGHGLVPAVSRGIAVKQNGLQPAVLSVRSGVFGNQGFRYTTVTECPAGRSALSISPLSRKSDISRTGALTSTEPKTASSGRCRLPRTRFMEFSISATE